MRVLSLVLNANKPRPHLTKPGKLPSLLTQLLNPSLGSCSQKNKFQTPLSPSSAPLSGVSNNFLDYVSPVPVSRLHYLTPFCPFKLPIMHCSPVLKIFPSSVSYSTSVPSPLPTPNNLQLSIFMILIKVLLSVPR